MIEPEQNSLYNSRDEQNMNLSAIAHPNATQDAFVVTNPDLDLSPMTGMTRQHYIECAQYVLGRAFRHVKSFDQPIVFPLVPGKSYPQPNDPEWRVRSYEFEALERTFNLAAPLIHVDPEMSIGNIKLRDYYCHHFYNALTPGHANSLPLPEDLPDATYQFTCEFGGLTKTLLLMPDVLWPHLSQQQRDAMAVTISKWAHHRTTQNNWRLFNICALSFLKKHGYAIDDDLLKSHLMWIASYHAGNGWYLEQSYNYYTISLFVVYGTIWSQAFGREHYPEIAAVLEKSFAELFQTYTNFFGRNGFINMWARSICYRSWISGGFPASFLLEQKPPFDPGWARRLCSGSILQFTAREDFYQNDIPSLGFYGHREFAIQNYSCPASPFIMFLPFIALALPEDSPFWTAKENDGMWAELGGKSKRTVLEKPGIVLVNHGSSGSSEIVSGKVYDDDHNYSKLVFNTHFPWEDHNRKGGTSQEYSFRSLDPRDLRGVDINFYLTGRTVDNTAAKSGAYSDFAEHALQRRAQWRALPATDHAQAAEQRRRIHHRPGGNHRAGRRGARGSLPPRLRARTHARPFRPAPHGRGERRRARLRDGHGAQASRPPFPAARWRSSPTPAGTKSKARCIAVSTPRRTKARCCTSIANAPPKIRRWS